MTQKNEVQEIRNDAFYFKQLQEGQPLQFAYLHLAEEADKTFLAVFENTSASTPLVYWWNEDDVEAQKESRHFIIEFIGEAYMSLYVARKLVKPLNKPLWAIAHLDNAIIPLTWRPIVKSISRENYGSRNK